MKRKIIAIGMLSMFLLAGLYPISIEGNAVSLGKDGEGIVSAQQNEKVEIMSSGENDWPMFQHDPEHSGYSTSTAPNKGTIRWSKNLHCAPSSIPIIVNDKVYLSTALGLYCFDANRGRQLWDFQWPGLDRGDNPVVVNGKVFVSDSSILYCLDAGTGDSIWQNSVDGMCSSITVVDNNIYFGTYDGKVYCVDAEKDGQSKWCYDTGNGDSWICFTPAVSGGRLYVGSEDNYVYCLDAEGNDDGTTNLIWSFETGGKIFSSPSVYDGRVYVESDDGYVYCLDANNSGAIIWTHSVGIAADSAAIAYGKIYVGASGKLYCLDLVDNGDGTTNEIWTYSFDAGLRYLVVSDGKIYVGFDSSGGSGPWVYIYCLDANGNGDGTTNVIWRKYTGGDCDGLSIGNGRLYASVFVSGLTVPGKLFCFGPKFSDKSALPKVYDNLNHFAFGLNFLKILRYLKDIII